MIHSFRAQILKLLVSAIIFSLHPSLKLFSHSSWELISNRQKTNISSHFSGQNTELGPVISSLRVYRFYAHFKEGLIKWLRSHSENMVQNEFEPMPGWLQTPRFASRFPLQLDGGVGPAVCTPTHILHLHSCRRCSLL